ncbi:MAG: nuclear transport factor 2 family protein [Pleurocapsa sp. MO_226.B13]|nr:nuclear transport factor 2 family protein [Pleurocapsa sp. MO_226.B13]
MKISENQNDATEIARLSRAWLEAISPKEDVKNFNFMERMSCFYETGDNLILFDNADPETRIANSASEYGRIWDSLLRQLDYLDIQIIREPIVFVDGNLAVSILVWKETTFTNSNRVEQHLSFLGTVIWQRTEQSWRIIHEHATTLSDKTEY